MSENTNTNGNGINVVVMEGNVVADAVVSHAPTGTPFVNFRLAVGTGHGSYLHTLFANVKMAGKRAAAAAPHFKKGTRLAIRGELRTDEYEKDGERRWFTYIWAEDFTFQPGGPKRE